MKNYKITVNGQVYDVAVESVDADQQVAVAPKGVSQPAAAVKAAPQAPSVGAGTEVAAPMPGTILDVKVSQGADVKAGDTIVVLEAMKMENDIVAPCDGKVTSLLVKKGDTVNSNDILATVG